MAIILPYSGNASALCGKRLAEGELVAFPTETVYGLGANALDKNAVQKVFGAKGRPSTDPLIVHVAQLNQVWSIVDLSPLEKECVEILAAAFWPGPLTLVMTSNSLIPLEVTAGKNSVGVRIPDHKVALELLGHAGVPVAAPSANKFGHVSPTTAQHVLDDLSESNISILDGGSCQVGIESTVLKMVDAQNFVLLRRGAVSPEQILQALRSANKNISMTEFRREEKSVAVAQDAPGQLLTHYAPKIPTYILRKSSSEKFFTAQELKFCVLLDFNKRNIELKDKCLGYRDLSDSGSADEVASNLFKLLRWAENLPGARVILLPDLEGESNSLLCSVHDRLYRSGSGKYASISNPKNNLR